MSNELVVLNNDPSALISNDTLFSSSRDALNVSKNFVTLGSFWNKQMCAKGRAHAKTLSNISLRTYTITKLENAINNYKNKSDALFVTNAFIDLSKTKASIEDITEETNATIADQNENVMVSDGAGSTFEVKISLGANKYQLISVPFSKGIRITKIYTYPSDTVYTAAKKVLLPDIDFWQTNQSLIFKTNIAINDLFANGYISYDGTIESSSKEGQSLYKGTTGYIDNMPCGEKSQIISNYVNGFNQSPKDFELMLNSIIDAPILLRGNAKLTYIGLQHGAFNDLDTSSKLYADMTKNAYYCFEDNVTKEHFIIKSNCSANMSNFSLNIGDIVPKGWVIDYPIKCFYNQSIDDLPADAKAYATQFVNPLVISIAKQIVERIWKINAAKSKDYFYNKYPTVDVLIQRLILAIKQYAPIGCIPILRVINSTDHSESGTTGTITF